MIMDASGESKLIENHIKVVEALKSMEDMINERTKEGDKVTDREI
jgi:SM-20-related protein